MAKRKIISVDFEFPGEEVEYDSIDSHRSLQDADIIVFRPTFGDHEFDDDEVSVIYEHWKSELKMAFNDGKTIFAFMTEPISIEINTEDGEESLYAYEMLPVQFTSIRRGYGNAIVPTKHMKLLANYWQQFAEYSSFEAYIEGVFTSVLFTTKGGSQIIGASYNTLFLLPDLQYDDDEFLTTNEKYETSWTDKATVFGSKLVSALVEIDKALHSNDNETPIPDWAITQEYRLDIESEIEGIILSVKTSILELQTRLTILENELSEAGNLRRLLFASGHSLEYAILDALRLMGFKAEQYKDGESEFDVVFTSLEGRFIGEAEGKDNKPINIDKLSQLERVINEDYTRDDITEYAKGILFGNAFRLTPLTKRADFFTEKCISGAKRVKAALVRTPDLFYVAQYLKNQNDPEFATKCRMALALTEGAIVEFPPIPKR